ncbi:hypothetical protein N8H72_19615 [Pseudomonas koreensis]|uniref:hypothetical protein n=1 Tax=Pseudomonas koreensis TaxID=198620 RepID=UPI0021C82D57|nr:hypothetical protein [Pseudomonas koreensis]MCU0092190.1 hypothetical protein [Pseudomonas koreensis]
MSRFHSVVFWSLLATGIVWGVFFGVNMSPGIYTLKNLAISAVYVVYGIVLGFFWPTCYVSLASFLHSRLGKSGEFFLAQSKSVQKDMVVAAVTGGLLVLIYFLDTADYSFSGVDIAFVGVPFLVSAFYTYVECWSIKVAGRPIQKKAALVMLGGILMVTISAIALLIKNSSSELSVESSLFLQVSVILCGLQFFLGDTLLLFCLSRQQAHFPPFIKDFFSIVVFSPTGLTSRVASKVEDTNRVWQQHKSEAATAFNKKQKANAKKRLKDSR